MNVWHDIDPAAITAERFTAVIEIPGGSKKKYELDKKTGLLRLDRILHTSTHYPTNYGFIPRTFADDHDPLDVLVISQLALDPLVMVDCYPIGVIRMVDGEEIDDKIIAVPCKDPNFNYLRDLSELPPHMMQEYGHFFEVYKSLEHKTMTTSESLGRESAIEIIQHCIDQYLVHFCGKVSTDEVAKNTAAAQEMIAKSNSEA
ncbi:MAG: inorganic diphosphatase [Eubacteriales bacterium]|nr:inorganic diphosphatase [Eubacteriales bacterium]